jgi:hypothetical protein
LTDLGVEVEKQSTCLGGAGCEKAYIYILILGRVDRYCDVQNRAETS